MTRNILTPFDFSLPEGIHRPLGVRGKRRFWKQVLPVTSIDYDGQRVNFDPAFHKQLELAYKDKVYDQVPLVFADAANGHNEDPRNFGGEVVKMENRGAKGTWALIEADKSAAKAIAANPRLGVSARIVQGVAKNGKQYGAAVRHVLMTMFPRVQGMEPWQAVDLSDGDADVEVVDLTAESFEQEDGAMGTKTAKTKAKPQGPQIDLSALSDEEFQQFLDLAEKGGLAIADPDEEVELDEDGNPIDPEDEGEGEGEGDEPKAKKKKSKKVVTIENESEEEGGDDSGDVADLSDHHDPRFTAFLEQHAKDQWTTTRSGFVSKGVPPFLVDLAEPILTKPEVLDLSDGDGKKVSAQSIVRQILDGVSGVVDLSDEFGHQVDLSRVADDEADAFVKAWHENYR